MKTLKFENYEFHVGGNVILKSGGNEMTIIEIESNIILTKWIPSEGPQAQTVCEARFPPEALIPVESLPDYEETKKLRKMQREVESAKLATIINQIKVARSGLKLPKGGIVQPDLTT